MKGEYGELAVLEEGGVGRSASCHSSPSCHSSDSSSSNANDATEPGLEAHAEVCALKLGEGAKGVEGGLGKVSRIPLSDVRDERESAGTCLLRMMVGYDVGSVERNDGRNDGRVEGRVVASICSRTGVSGKEAAERRRVKAA